MIQNYKALVFDGDDTLWQCSKYYWQCRDNLVEFQVKRTGLNPETVASLYSVIDGQMLKLPGAFGRDRFPRTFQAISLALDGMLGNEPDLAASEVSFEIGDAVFDAEYPIFQGVWSMLTELKNDYDVLVIINTKGDVVVQERKVSLNKLHGLIDGLHITLNKDVAHLESILKTHDLQPNEVLCIGDSMRDDVITSNAVGCDTLWISNHSPHHFKPRWEYEAQIEAPVQPTYWLKKVVDMNRSEAWKRLIPKMENAVCNQKTIVKHGCFVDFVILMSVVILVLFWCRITIFCYIHL